MTTEIATQAGHWYRADGSPAYTVLAKDGTERATTLRDARKLNLAPSVTTIIGCAAKPALDAWKQNQVLLAALTLPRIEGESDEAFCARVMQDSKEQGRKAAEKGQALHGAIEMHLQGKPYAAEWIPHVDAVLTKMLEYGVDLAKGEAEHSFTHSSGYGGKIDWHSRPLNIVLDFKSKPAIDDKTKAYDEHAMQLAAYGHGLGMNAPRMLNVFVGIDDKRVLIHEWEPADFTKGIGMFNALLTYWQVSKGYKPQ